MKFTQSADQAGYKIRLQRDAMLEEDVPQESNASEAFAAGLGFMIDEELLVSESLSKSSSEVVDWFRRKALKTDSNPYYVRNSQLQTWIEDGTLNETEIRSARPRSGRGLLDYSQLAKIAKAKGLQVSTDEELDENIRETLKQKRIYSEDTYDRAGVGATTAYFAGSLAGTVADPLTTVAGLVALPVRAATTISKAQYIAQSFGRGALVGAAEEAAIQPQVMSWKDDIESPYGLVDAAINVAMSAGFNGSIDGIASAGQMLYNRLHAMRVTESTNGRDTLTPEQLAQIDDTLKELEEVNIDLEQSKGLEAAEAIEEFVVDIGPEPRWGDFANTQDYQIAHALWQQKHQDAEYLAAVARSRNDGRPEDWANPSSRDSLYYAMDPDPRGGPDRAPNTRTHEPEANGRYALFYDDIRIDNLNDLPNHPRYNEIKSWMTFERGTLGQLVVRAVDNEGNIIPDLPALASSGGLRNSRVYYRDTPSGREYFSPQEVRRSIRRAGQKGLVSEDLPMSEFQQVPGWEDVQTALTLYTGYRSTDSVYRRQGLSRVIQQAQMRLADHFGFIPSSDLTLTQFGVTPYITRQNNPDYDIWENQRSVYSDRGQVEFQSRSSDNGLPNFIINRFPSIEGIETGNFRRAWIDKDAFYEADPVDARAKAKDQQTVDNEKLQKVIEAREAQEKQFNNNFGEPDRFKTERQQAQELRATQDQLVEEALAEFQGIQQETGEPIDVITGVDFDENGNPVAVTQSLDDFLEENRSLIQRMTDFVRCRRNNA